MAEVTRLPLEASFKKNKCSLRAGYFENLRILGEARTRFSALRLRDLRILGEARTRFSALRLRVRLEALPTPLRRDTQRLLVLRR